MTIEPGTRLNQYRLTDKIGAGGMGEVWAAEDATLKRTVAIKILPPEMADNAERRERFTREAQSVAALNHPNIVTIHSVEECDGVHFLTMELVDGEPLTRRIAGNGLDLDTFFELVIPLADAVAAAHERGITHRDLKPDNVMLARGDRVKVLDFGLAKLAAPVEESQDSVLPTRTVTKEGHIVGTVSYMSPEQAEGKSTDPRSDVFSLGIVIYEMTTGTRPFVGDTAISTITSILRDTPAPVAELRDDLPRHLDRVIRRCLAKEPERRYQSALELRNELEQLRDEIRSGDSLHQPTIARTPAPARRNPRLGIGLAIVAVVAIVAVAGVLLWPGRDDGTDSAPTVVPADETEQPKIVVLPFDNLGNADEEYFADGITEEITARLASADGIGVISRNSAFRYDRTDKTTAQIGEDFGVDYVLEGSVRWASQGDGESRVRIIPALVRVSDDVGVWSESFDTVLDDVFKVQARIASEVVTRLGVALADPGQEHAGERPTQSNSAYQAYLRGLSTKRLSDDRRLWTETAVSSFERATQLDPGFALAWAELSIAHSRSYHFGFDRTAERQELSRRAADRALEIDPELPQGYKALAYYHYWAMRDYEPALEAFDAAVERGLEGDDEIVSGIGFVKRRQGRWEEAAEHLSRATQLNPQDPTAYRNLAQTLLFLRRFDEAIDAYERTIIIAPDHPEPYLAYATLHRVRDGDRVRSTEILETMPTVDVRLSAYTWREHHLFFGDFEAALKALERADGPEVAPQLYTPVALARAELKQLAGRGDEARADFQRALEELDRELAARPDDYRIHGARGLALAGLGRNDEAIASAERAVEIYPLDRDAMSGADQLAVLARVYMNTGEIEKAREIAEQLVAIPSRHTEYLFAHSPRWAALRWDQR